MKSERICGQGWFSVVEFSFPVTRMELRCGRAVSVWVTAHVCHGHKERREVTVVRVNVRA